MSKLTCAFSRAQQEKVYVQHLLQKQVGSSTCAGVVSLCAWVLSPMVMPSSRPVHDDVPFAVRASHMCMT